MNLCLNLKVPKQEEDANIFQKEKNACMKIATGKNIYNSINVHIL